MCLAEVFCVCMHVYDRAIPVITIPLLETTPVLTWDLCSVTMNTQTQLQTLKRKK